MKNYRVFYTYTIEEDASMDVEAEDVDAAEEYVRDQFMEDFGSDLNEIKIIDLTVKEING